MESDWREILSLSQNELKEVDKEKLCESLSWMEADDIDLNFTDLKALFRLAQDILKYKTEQVNGLIGEMESVNRKSKASKKNLHSETFVEETEDVSSDDTPTTTARQKEKIKRNRILLEQLKREIDEMEECKDKLKNAKTTAPDIDSESSRNTLSEINDIALLEADIVKRNRHIRKLQTDISILEEENINLKDKLSVLNQTLKESTLIIENLTEQMVIRNKENNKFKEILGEIEKEKTDLVMELEAVKSESMESDYKSKKYEDAVSKVHKFKSLLKSYKNKIHHLTDENVELKENLLHTSKSSPPVQKVEQEDNSKIEELQEKLFEASEEILRSANLIEALKSENRQLKMTVVRAEVNDSRLDNKNQSDDGKEKIIINNLNKKVKKLTIALKATEEMVSLREKEIAEITSQLQLLRTDDGINALVKGIKSKRRELKVKDDGIKSLVNEINNLNQLINNTQLENEAMREQLGIPLSKQVDTFGILKKYRDMETTILDLTRKLQLSENKIITLEIDSQNQNPTINKIARLKNCADRHTKEMDSVDGTDDERQSVDYIMPDKVKSLIEENEGLRNGLQEILNFLKDNSTTSSGVLALECPSLDTLLQSMQARRLAGWFSPHMNTIMELRTAIGSKDALLTALHESRKETYTVMDQLSLEKKKCLDLEKVLNEIKAKDELKHNSQDEICSTSEFYFYEIGSWIADHAHDDINTEDKLDVSTLICKGNIAFENQLKNSLQYFQNKFTSLYNEFSLLQVTLTDNKNKWSVDEENYKAQIESLKNQIIKNDDIEYEDHSPGRINPLSISSLEKKCTYLEEMYKQIRTSNENIKNEYLECKKDKMLLTSEYEVKINKLILTVIKLTDKLRKTIPISLYLNQNKLLNEFILKYRRITENNVHTYLESVDLLKRLDRDKLDLLSRLHHTQGENEEVSHGEPSKAKLSSIEQSIVYSQLKQVLTELNTKTTEVQSLRDEVNKLQEVQSALLDKVKLMNEMDNVEDVKKQLRTVEDENKLLKEKYHYISGQLDTAQLHLQSEEQKRTSVDMEINMLRHQILDLQSNGDSKSIIARLSGETLLAQLQVTECQQSMDTLKNDLSKVKQSRADVEERFIELQKLFEATTLKYENRNRSLYEEINLLRQQYYGSLPLLSLDNFLTTLQDSYVKSCDINEKINEIEDLRSDFIRKNAAYQQILELSQNKCSEDTHECPHKMQHFIIETRQLTELDYYKQKLQAIDKSYKTLTDRYNDLEKKFQMLNQKQNIKCNIIQKAKGQYVPETLQVEDVNSDEDGDGTYTLKSAEKLPIVEGDNTNNNVARNIVTDSSCLKKNKAVQTVTQVIKTKVQETQTDSDKSETEVTTKINNLMLEKMEIEKLLTYHKKVSEQQSQEIMNLKIDKNNVDSKIKILSDTINHKDNVNRALRLSVDNCRRQLDNLESKQVMNIDERKFTETHDNQVLINNLKKIDSDKNTILQDYKGLLQTEREKFNETSKKFQTKIFELQTKLDNIQYLNVENNEAASGAGEVTSTSNKYTTKIVELEDKCFKLERELERYITDLNTNQDELGRWKELASERLIKMEQLSAQLKDCHKEEMESYKTENQHWIAQLNESQRDHANLRTQLAEQRAIHFKQLAEKDTAIEQLRFVINTLKSQLMNMQTFSTNDSNLDLSAIVEESRESISHDDSHKLELKFESSIDLTEIQDNILKVPSTSTMIWQEPLVERLRREKQLMTKQNLMLRRQIKTLAARERRARLDAQNLKNQVFRISTSTSKTPPAESTSMETKIASLQSQLSSARREHHSSVALWEKWKRSQQASERWQMKYEEKCQEVRKLETSLQLAKSAVSRLEKEKHLLLARLNEIKEEKREEERPQKLVSYKGGDSAMVSESALLARVAEQQYRIAALEVAEKGNEPLVREYERALAEVTSLKGQVLKLESALLESQIRLEPSESAHNNASELKYWKNYCDMLKDENAQLTLKLHSCESSPATADRQRVADLEQTVLTLRGLVSKLQVEQKSSSSVTNKRASIARGGASDRIRDQIDINRIEIANLKKSVQEKDILLERSKEMLKIAAGREEQLLRENTMLHHRLQDLAESRGRFLSA